MSGSGDGKVGNPRGFSKDKLNLLSITPIKDFCSSDDIGDFKMNVPKRAGEFYEVIVVKS
jgi:hypothetical protein